MSRFTFPLLLIGVGALSAAIALSNVQDAPVTTPVAAVAAVSTVAPSIATVSETPSNATVTITATREVPVTATEAPVTVTQEVVATEYIDRPGPTVTGYATMPVAVTEVQTVTQTVTAQPAPQSSAPEVLRFEDGSSLPADQVGEATSVADANQRACMLAADRIVSYGWSGAADEVQCFGHEDNLAAINDAYGALEAESGKGSYTNPHPGYATCATEDAPGPCFWSASEQGNGQGHSFLREANGSITYLS